MIIKYESKHRKVVAQDDSLKLELGATKADFLFSYLYSDSKYTGHVETSFHKIIDVDSQPEFLQPVKQRVIVSHLEKKTKDKNIEQIRTKRQGKLQNESNMALFQDIKYCKKTTEHNISK